MIEKVQYKGDNLREFFARSTVFNHLTEEQLDYLPLDQATDRYKRGSIIYEEGSRISGFYVVCKGVIKIFKTGFDGKDQIIRFAKPGDVMGFRSTITGELLPGVVVVVVVVLVVVVVVVVVVVEVVVLASIVMFSVHILVLWS